MNVEKSSDTPKKPIAKWPFLIVGIFAALALLGALLPVIDPEGYARIQREAEAAASAKTEKQDAKALALQQAFDDGWLVGKTDAYEGRARDGQKAMRLGRIHSESYPDFSSAYASEYHSGYNEGWHAMRAVIKSAQ